MCVYTQRLYTCDIKFACSIDHTTLLKRYYNPIVRSFFSYFQRMCITAHRRERKLRKIMERSATSDYDNCETFIDFERVIVKADCMTRVI